MCKIFLEALNAPTVRIIKCISSACFLHIAVQTTDNYNIKFCGKVLTAVEFQYNYRFHNMSIKIGKIKPFDDCLAPK